MAPQWMPQNIQKRLLLYLLQQLSLFSGIDLENLEVSLGSSSQVTLNDVEIDTDAFKIPGVHLRNGRIKNLQLKLNMSGGVNFEIDGLFITMALAYTANNQSSSTLSKSTTSMLESILTEHSKETIAQSTLDLAQSLIHDEDFQTPAQSFHQSLHVDQSEDPTPSTLNSVMSKAVEMALARLNVNVKNISVRVIMDHATVDLEIKDGSLVTEDGVRTIKIGDVILLSTHPSENPGEFCEEKPEVNAQVDKESVTENGKTSNDEYEDQIDVSSDSGSDSDNDETIEQMMASSILERTKDLDSSLIYSKDDASSIYMSAASDTFEARRQELSEATRLLFINDITVTFNESLAIEKLNVQIDKIKISAVPLPLTLLHVVESLGILKPQESYQRSSNLSHNLRQQKQKYENDDVASGALVESLTINEIEMNLVSALLATGEFSKPEELRLVAQEIQLNQNDHSLVYGSIDRVKLFDGVDTYVGCFEGESSKKDIRFEKKLDSDAFTLLLYKDLSLKLEKNHVQRILDFSELLPQILESLNKLNTNKPINIRHHEVSNTIQTSNIFITVNLNEVTALCLKISPISFESKLGSLSIDKVSVSKLRNGISSPLVTILNSNYQIHKAEKQFRSYDNKGNEMVFTTNSTLSISSIQFEHDFNSLLQLKESINSLFEFLTISEPKIIFKTRKKARISSNLAFSSRAFVKLNVTIDSIEFNISSVNEKFGDLGGLFKNLTLLVHKDNALQLHIFNGVITRTIDETTESFFRMVNPDDIGSPIISVKTNKFKNIDILFRNSIIDYYTEWISLLETIKSSDLDNSSLMNIQSESTERLSNAEEKRELHFNLVDVAIGLNPGRLKAKSVLVIANGNLEILIEHQITVKSELRSPSLHLIDDVATLLSHSDAKRNRNYNKSWSQASYFNSQGFVPIAKSKNISFQIDIKPFVDNQGISTKSINFDIFTETLDFELCADSCQCFISLVNDLKQPIVIKPESKYKVNGKEVDVFGEIEEDAFNETTVEVSNNSETPKDEPLFFVDDYYQESQDDDDKSDEILGKSLSELNVNDRSELANNPFFGVQETPQDSTSSTDDKKSVDSDSTLLFEDDHFEEKVISSKSTNYVPQYPMVLDLKITKVTIKIYDGYDWKYSRTTISNAVKNLEKRVTEQQKLRAELLSRGLSEHLEDPENRQEESRVFGETLFDSIHVSLPVNTADPLKLTQKINKNLQNIDTTIEFGKNNIKKLKLHRTKLQKVFVELNEVQVLFTLLSSQDPLVSLSTMIDSGTSDDFDLVNETIIKVADFEITDNVPTSTWNKFVTLLKDVEREGCSNMLSLKVTTIRPISSSAATELIIDAEVLPLRLHVDQDTLEVLTRFGEFKDSRFQLVDEYEDIIYIQKFSINAIKVKLDYKPKKIDYAGLRSGHTTEFMNLFILDEVLLVLKKVTLYGISGFARLSQLLNGLWMPDIKQTQLTGVLSGLAPVRSIYNIGSNFKDLVVVPLNEYKKDGRIYRSVSKGVTEFGKNTTNELLKFGIKLANGTQTLLENAEYALGGSGSAARIPIDSSKEIPDELSEAYSNINNDLDDSDGDDTRFGLQSQLIGRSSLQNPMSRSTFQPELESISDIDQEMGFKGSHSNQPSRSSPYSQVYRNNLNHQLLQDGGELINEEDEIQRTISLYANQPSNLREGLLLAYDSLGRNFLVAKDAIVNAGYEINEAGSAQSLTIAIAKATPIALLRPLIGATEATSRALYGINNELDPSSRKLTDDKYKQVKKK